jgi:hypothetical protein
MESIRIYGERFQVGNQVFNTRPNAELTHLRVTNNCIQNQYLKEVNEREIMNTKDKSELASKSTVIVTAFEGSEKLVVGRTERDDKFDRMGRT